MKFRSTSSAVATVLGAVTCIVLLAILASCGGGGSDPTDAQAKFDLRKSVVHPPGLVEPHLLKTVLLEFPAAP